MAWCPASRLPSSLCCSFCCDGIVMVASRFDYDTANAWLKRDVQLLLSAALSSGLVMRVCAPSVLCTGAGAKHQEHTDHRS